MEILLIVSIALNVFLYFMMKAYKETADKAVKSWKEDLREIQHSLKTSDLNKSQDVYLKNRQRAFKTWRN